MITRSGKDLCFPVVLVFLSMCVLALTACHRRHGQHNHEEHDGVGLPDTISRSAVSEEKFMIMRKDMVENQIKARGIKNEKVLKALEKVPRHEFVPPEYVKYSYHDSPQPIGEDQTISQPYIVALMSELLDPDEDDRILEIGTGSGYQAAVLAEIAKEVYSIEIIKSLAESAQKRLEGMGYSNIHVPYGDGFKGLPKEAPFDGIIVTCAPSEIPQPLLDQLAVGGRLVIPVGDYFQELILVTRTEEGYDRKTGIPVRFVPMTGEAIKKKK